MFVLSTCNALERERLAQQFERETPDVRAQHNALERERQARRRENMDVRAQHNTSEREMQAQQRENTDVRSQHNASERLRQAQQREDPVFRAIYNSSQNTYYHISRANANANLSIDKFFNATFRCCFAGRTRYYSRRKYGRTA